MQQNLIAGGQVLQQVIHICEPVVSYDTGRFSVHFDCDDL